MKFGVIPGYYAAPVATADYAAGLASAAEELGFESIWPVEHVVMPEEYTSVYPYSPDGRMPIPDADVPDPIIWNTWAAANTKKLIVGTAMAILPQHNPLVYAKALASLDQLSGGRVILGAGIGWLKEEAEALGTDFRNRGKRTDEYIEAMKTVWREPIASYSGKHVSFDKVKCNPRPVQEGGVPIHIGGHSQAAARRAGRLGDGFLPLGGSIEELDGLWKVVEATAKEHGRDPSEIELTYSGMATHDFALQVEQAGAQRMLIASVEPDLESAKRALGEFSENVIATLGDA
ncbi:MAG: LLM class F420-dependent oxidoreductase [Myxococcota bacterium]|jgi:probable F420-dependent oxidoreductase|nr:LLM class F420-dependent oxidoreductase [Myxococcota bacterium]